MTLLAFVSGCAGHVLTARECAFLREAQPWGLILFKRNIDTPAQVRALVATFRATVGRADAPVLIDQEGGRVQRMGPPHWPLYPPAAAFDSLTDRDAAAKQSLARVAARLMARDLAKVGITIDCLPVLDVAIPGAHSVVGNRAYAENPALVSDYGRAVSEGMLAGGVLPVMKHAPGHGRAKVDSHHELPIVDATRETLEQIDFLPFRRLAGLPIAMTAHVVYQAIDPEAPATTSGKVIGEVIRGHIGFDGLLLSDDMSMKALSGTLRDRASATFAAGVDIALHCNGNIHEASEVAAAAPVLAGRSLARAEAALRRLSPADDSFDPVDARAKLDAALAALV
jgi:beta-N-acetylhexosaminidase